MRQSPIARDSRCTVLRTLAYPAYASHMVEMGVWPKRDLEHSPKSHAKSGSCPLSAPIQGLVACDRWPGPRLSSSPLFPALGLT